jgi:acyl-CoA synthetase (AMP-forming)/AMP-acid ligase II
LNINFILEKALSLYPDKEAVVCREHRFTYRQFGARVYGLARFLHATGIRQGDRVAILHENSHEFIEAYFAAAQLGAVLNPLNIRLRPLELAPILADSGATLLIASVRFRAEVEALIAMETELTTVIWTGTAMVEGIRDSISYEEAVAAQGSNPPHPPSLTDDDVAQLYYTSGTTGVPKGVMLSHKNVCTHALAAVAELRLGDHDHWLHVAPLFHLADAWATFALTWVGGKHVVVPDFDVSDVLRAIRTERVTITNMIPSMLNTLINTPEVDGCDFSSLRTMMSGGAPIAPDLVRGVMETFKCDYIQTYGMTETSPYLSVSILKQELARLSPEEQFRYKAKTGRPFLGVLLKVVREDGSEVEPNDREVGEIIVKGDIVTNGYWNRPEETRKALRSGWLYTGDLAVLDREGYINIVDRKKDMIITGGENVYSIEVENALYALPYILETAVVGVPDPKWGEAVKAVVVLRPGHQVTEAKVIQDCKARIAGYKAPKSVDFVSELPKTGSGKISKKALKQLRS